MIDSSEFSSTATIPVTTREEFTGSENLVKKIDLMMIWRDANRNLQFFDENGTRIIFGHLEMVKDADKNGQVTEIQRDVFTRTEFVTGLWKYVTGTEMDDKMKTMLGTNENLVFDNFKKILTEQQKEKKIDPLSLVALYSFNAGSFTDAELALNKAIFFANAEDPIIPISTIGLKRSRDPNKSTFHVLKKPGNAGYSLVTSGDVIGMGITTFSIPKAKESRNIIFEEQNTFVQAQMQPGNKNNARQLIEAPELGPEETTLFKMRAEVDIAMNQNNKIQISYNNAELTDMFSSEKIKMSIITDDAAQLEERTSKLQDKKNNLYKRYYQKRFEHFFPEPSTGFLDRIFDYFNKDFQAYKNAKPEIEAEIAKFSNAKTDDDIGEIIARINQLENNLKAQLEEIHKKEKLAEIQEPKPNFLERVFSWFSRRQSQSAADKSNPTPVSAQSVQQNAGQNVAQSATPSAPSNPIVEPVKQKESIEMTPIKAKLAQLHKDTSQQESPQAQSTGQPKIDEKIKIKSYLPHIPPELHKKHKNLMAELLEKTKKPDVTVEPKPSPKTPKSPKS